MKGRHEKGLAVPSNRLARLSHLGAMTASVAGNMALGGVAQLGRGQRPDMRSLMLTPANVRRVADQLAKMRGAAMKIGQLVSMDSGDVLPPELAQIMARLRDDAHFMPPAQLKKVLTAEWRENWLRDFTRFDVRPVAAASIGQVHRAQLRDGRDLAIKVQYPGVAQSIDSDVANVGALVRMSGLLPKGIELAPYLAEAARQLHEETDYDREAICLQQFRRLLTDTKGFTLPEVHQDWSTSRILAMDFVRGIPIEEAVNETQEVRDGIMSRLISLTLREVFDFRVMQSDPNFANYRYDPQSGDVVLLDFGAVREIDKGISEAYRSLLRVRVSSGGEDIEEALASLGFINENTVYLHREAIREITLLAFEGLRKPVFDFADTTLPRLMQSKGEALARDGYVPPLVPMDVLYVQRKFAGMFLLGARLRAKLPLAQMLAPYLEA